jgi:hypothetical protein
LGFHVDVANAAPGLFNVLIRMTSQLFERALHQKGNPTVTFVDRQLLVIKSTPSLKGQASQIHVSNEIPGVGR